MAKSTKEAIRIIDYVDIEFPGNLSCRITDRDIKSIATLLESNKFDSIMYLYGIKFLLSVLKYYEQKERYEKCAMIFAQIQYHNKQYKDKLPTKL